MSTEVPWMIKLRLFAFEQNDLDEQNDIDKQNDIEFRISSIQISC
jgi:hypothetical protein